MSNLIEAHEAFSCVDTRGGVRTLCGRVTAKQLLLVFPKHRVCPIRSLNILDVFKESGATHVHFSDDRVLTQTEQTECVQTVTKEIVLSVSNKAGSFASREVESNRTRD